MCAWQPHLQAQAGQAGQHGQVGQAGIVDSPAAFEVEAAQAAKLLRHSRKPPVGEAGPVLQAQAGQACQLPRAEAFTCTAALYIGVLSLQRNKHVHTLPACMRSAPAVGVHAHMPCAAWHRTAGHRVDAALGMPG